MKHIRHSSALWALWGLLPLLTTAGISLMIKQVRNDLSWVRVQTQKQSSEQRAWWGLERFFADSKSCSTFFRGKRLGEAVIEEAQGFGPKLGQEWLKTGWIVKDVYVLRRVDEVAWNLRQELKSDTAYVKVSLVPRPSQGQAMGVDYLLSAPSISRIFPVKMTLGEERTFPGCDQSQSQLTCQREAFKVGGRALMLPSRSLASKGLKCKDGGFKHQARCLLAGDHFPIWNCE